MTINASVQDISYVPTTTYPTETTIIITNSTTEPITGTYTPPTTTGVTPSTGIWDVYIIGLFVISAAGLFGLYWIINTKRTRWVKDERNGD